MSNSLSVLGFGQCGSRVAVSISASFTPSNILTDVGLFDIAINFIVERFRSKNTNDKDESPKFYIADLNASNDIYMYFTKIQAIQDILSSSASPNSLKDDEIIRKLGNRGIPKAAKDEELIEDVRRCRISIGGVNALHFNVYNRPLYELGGAGGVQYLSEIIAEHDTDLLKAIDQRQLGALIGIFSLGGGTGSGSLFAVLSNYKKQYRRYTIGVGILPYRQSTDEFSNAGRYLTKYLGTQKTDRFHTLLLFSNETARDVLTNVKSDELDSSEPMDVVNLFITSFTRDFSLINDSRTTTLFGKLFDPMDGKRYLSRICTIGYSFNDSILNVKDLFIKAISPMSFENKRLSGIAIRLIQDEHKVRTKIDDIRELIKKLVDAIDTGEEIKATENLDNNKDVYALHQKTPFYRTIKAVYVFFFVSKEKDQSKVFKFQSVILRFFQVIAGDDVNININCYLAPDLEEGSDDNRNSLLLLIGGAFGFEIYDSVIKYIRKTFIPSEKGIKFEDNFNTLLAEIKKKRSSEMDLNIASKVEEILQTCDCAAKEQKSGEELDILNNEDVRILCEPSKLEKYLLTQEYVKTALEEISENFTLGANKIQGDSSLFNDF